MLLYRECLVISLMLSLSACTPSPHHGSSLSSVESAHDEEPITADETETKPFDKILLDPAAPSCDHDHCTVSDAAWDPLSETFSWDEGCTDESCTDTPAPAADRLLLKRVVGGLATVNPGDPIQECLLKSSDVANPSEAETIVVSTRTASLKTASIFKPIIPSIQIFAYLQGQEILVYEAHQNLRTLSLGKAADDAKIQALIELTQSACEGEGGSF